MPPVVGILTRQDLRPYNILTAFPHLAASSKGREKENWVSHNHQMVLTAFLKQHVSSCIPFNYFHNLWFFHQILNWLMRHCNDIKFHFIVTVLFIQISFNDEQQNSFWIQQHRNGLWQLLSDSDISLIHDSSSPFYAIYPSLMVHLLSSYVQLAYSPIGH